jgi:hypothetical protein
MRDAIRPAVAYAREAGDNLNEAKEELRRRRREGREVPSWARWLKDHFQGSHRTANVYQRVAREWEEISHLVDAPNFSIRKALQFLDEEETEEEETVLRPGDNPLDYDDGPPDDAPRLSAAEMYEHWLNKGAKPAESEYDRCLKRLKKRFAETLARYDNQLVIFLGHPDLGNMYDFCGCLERLEKQVGPVAEAVVVAYTKRKEAKKGLHKLPADLQWERIRAADEGYKRDLLAALDGLTEEQQERVRHFISPYDEEEWGEEARQVLVAGQPRGSGEAHQAPPLHDEEAGCRNCKTDPNGQPRRGPNGANILVVDYDYR